MAFFSIKKRMSQKVIFTISGEIKFYVSHLQILHLPKLEGLQKKYFLRKESSLR